MTEGAETRLASAVVLQAVIDYIKGRRRLDKRSDWRAELLVADVAAFMRSDEFNDIFLPSWAKSGEQLLEMLESRYRTVSLKTPRDYQYYHRNEKARRLERQAACPGHQYKPHSGRIYDGICTICGAKRRRNKEEMPYAW